MEDTINAARKLLSSYQAGMNADEFFSFLPPETQNYSSTIRHRISHDELPLVRSEIKRTAKRIYDNWGSLEPIVQRHEATIQKRWTSKSITKRRELLLATWPNMARDHRPDIVLANKAGNLTTKKLPQGRQRQQQKQYEGSQREALLMPYMNLHDLTKTEPLLLMINARARRSPHAFSRRDIQLSTDRHDLTKWQFLAGYVMDLNGWQSAPESYGELRQAPKETFKCVAAADPRLAGGFISPGDGLWVLEIQDRIYKFLHDIVQKILHNIPPDDLTGPKYIARPEPSLPSANSRENDVVSLASTNLEAIYSPPAQLDLRRLQSLVAAKANEEEDKLWALREDPGRFAEGQEDLFAHRPEYVQDLLGKQHPTITINARQTRWASDVRSLEDFLSTDCVMASCACVQFWSGLVRDITALVELKAQHFDGKDIEPGAPLPEPFALALYNLQFVLWIFIEHRLLVLPGMVYSSPPFRPYMRRASPDTLDRFELKPDAKLPRHICEFINILCDLTFASAIKLRGHITSVQLLLERYNMFINTVPDAQLAISSCVAEEISHITLLSECLRQIQLFQPWEASLDKGLTAMHIQAAFEAHYNERQRETEEFAKFVPSARARSLATATAKRPYPVHKKRTAESVRAMQAAEALLDQMWGDLLAEMEQQSALPRHAKKVLLLQGRQLQRTPDWVEPEPVKPSNMAPPQTLSPEALIQPFGGIGIDDNAKVQVRPAQKTKPKTRGIAVSQTLASNQVQMTEPEDQGPVHTIQVDRRAVKVFSALFHTSSSTSPPREVPWNDFLHAMRSAGFWMEKLYGSVWQFAPRDDNSNIHMTADTRTILFHEPHPHSRIPFRQARRHGRRLARAYGWSGQTFVLKH